MRTINWSFAIVIAAIHSGCIVDVNETKGAHGCSAGIEIDLLPCLVDTDCGWGFVCGSDSTCIPECGPECDPTTPASPQACADDSQCPMGSYCYVDFGVCLDSGICSKDYHCDDGYVCDTERASCIPAPTACSDLSSEDDCLSRLDCEPVYAGINCTCGPDCVCTGTEENCVCESFEYFTCGEAPAAY